MEGLLRRRWRTMTWALIAWDVCVLAWLIHRGPTPPCGQFYGRDCWPAPEGLTTIISIWLVVGLPLLAAAVVQEFRRRGDRDDEGWPPVWTLTVLTVLLVMAVLVSWGPPAPTILPVHTGPITSSPAT